MAQACNTLHIFNEMNDFNASHVFVRRSKAVAVVVVVGRCLELMWVKQHSSQSHRSEHTAKPESVEELDFYRLQVLYHLRHRTPTPSTVIFGSAGSHNDHLQQHLCAARRGNQRIGCA